jgi:hypothetical protein
MRIFGPPLTKAVGERGASMPLDAGSNSIEVISSGQALSPASRSTVLDLLFAVRLAVD